MSRNRSGATVNQGPAPDPDRDEVGEVAGNARRRGEKPSPADRDRGETSAAEEAVAVDFDTAHDRAS